MSSRCGCKIDGTPIGFGVKTHSFINYCPTHAQAFEMLKIIDDLNYVFTNVFAPDYKKIHDEFMPRCREILNQTEKNLTPEGTA